MERIVWTNGCFDVLHMGHIELFRYAKQQGTKLYVGVDSDEKVKQDKGQDRPFNNLNDRIQFLRAIRYVDKVIPFNSTQHLEETIKNISPDVMVIGADWRGKVVVGEQYAGKLKFFNRISGYSTTNILEWKKNQL